MKTTKAQNLFTNNFHTKKGKNSAIDR